MRKLGLACGLAGLTLLGACATTDEGGWTGAGEPFGQAETTCRQEAQRAPASAQKGAFEECMARAGWRRL
ncbi:hypothetical protein [Caulobacter sp. 17J65-9]|uniref:hypothetical protein n=1 Tax=Caulobacter sp. 17J65-9 TaxID=2709382 RepID=UPI0013CAE16D|nr:hypothetical protein [Caulobacter sp. 17J65-9]NEX92915.1 hypothetical protein [Caulobacter sp. 17J65-9]